MRKATFPWPADKHNAHELMCVCVSGNHNGEDNDEGDDDVDDKGEDE